MTGKKKLRPATNKKRGSLEWADIEKTRAALGMDPLDLKERKCLRCGGMFMTTKLVRICCATPGNQLAKGWEQM